jgi:hypothetical protein
MTSLTPTLLDPFEIGPGPRAPLPSLASLDQPTEWFDRSTFSFSLSHVALVEEITETPPWTPEPIDRRWRARGWTDDG